MILFGQSIAIGGTKKCKEIAVKYLRYSMRGAACVVGALVLWCMTDVVERLVGLPRADIGVTILHRCVMLFLAPVMFCLFSAVKEGRKEIADAQLHSCVRIAAVFCAFMWLAMSCSLYGGKLYVMRFVLDGIWMFLILATTAAAGRLPEFVPEAPDSVSV